MHTDNMQKIIAYSPKQNPCRMKLKLYAWGVMKLVVEKQ